MAYEKTEWVSEETELSAENMNHIEGGIKENNDLILLFNDLLNNALFIADPTETINEIQNILNSESEE
jgi:hypothetical protein